MLVIQFLSWNFLSDLFYQPGMYCGVKEGVVRCLRSDALVSVFNICIYG